MGNAACSHLQAVDCCGRSSYLDDSGIFEHLKNSGFVDHMRIVRSMRQRPTHYSRRKSSTCLRVNEEQRCRAVLPFTTQKFVVATGEYHLDTRPSIRSFRHGLSLPAKFV